MSKSIDPIISLSRCDGGRKPVDIVFVHGLMGSAKETWSSDSSDTAFWPKWFSEIANVWVLDYPADVTWWPSSGADMALPERARSIIDVLVNHEIGKKPLIFVTHSLGGLLVKNILRTAKDMNEPLWREMLKNTRGVAFLGTPHTGASLGSIADLLRVFGLKTNATQLKSNSAHLIELGQWYSKNAKKNDIKSLAYYEKGKFRGLKIVDESSADPRVDDCNPIPCDANHIDICKPKSQSDQIHMGVMRFIRTTFGIQSSPVPSEAEAALYNINSVFGIHRGDTCHYVERDSVDDAFLEQLIKGNHICVYGSSKQGKTALRKKHITADQVTVVCDRDWAVEDIFLAILKAAGFVVRPRTEMPGSTELVIHGASVLINASNTAEFIEALNMTKFGKYIVIEEFHYLSESVQRDLAFKLKAVHELSIEYTFIIIGVWLEKNRLVHLNKDLSGRVAPINADEWTDSDLMRVIKGGELKLNIAFPPGYAEKLVERACGSVFLVREACHRACEIAGIYKRSDVFMEIDASLNVTAILKEISKSGVDYPGQIVSLLDLESVGLNEREREEGLKEWVLKMLITAGAKDLRKGISLKKLRSLIRQRHPQRYHPTESQIERVIKTVQSAQLESARQNLFDYDRQEKMVRCVDKGFLLWRMGTTPEKIEHLAFEGEMPIA